MTLRILMSPLRLAGALTADQVGLLVAIDTIVRWARASGRQASAVATTLAGHITTQHAVERELAREGHDRESLGRDTFVDRMRSFESAWREEAATTASAAGVDIGVDLTVAATDSPAVAEAARIAFVRLYEQGLVELAERIVESCPRCGTVVHAADAEVARVEGEVLTIRFGYVDGGGEMHVRLRQAELLAGAVGIAVPPGHGSEGRPVISPLTGRELPVVSEFEVNGPELLVPAHDARAHDIARRHRLTPIDVLHFDGTMRVDGPLDGLGRFAARALARELLDAEAAVVAAESRDQRVGRCLRCGTALVPRLGRHWFLRTRDLEAAAADAVRNGVIDFSPAGARDDFLAWAGHADAWCLSHQLWGGHAIPVSTCADCGTPAVEVTASTTCRKCLGALKADESVFDARFLGVIWALAASGWPVEERAVGHLAGHTVFVLRPGALFTWGVPIAALGLRLAGAVPFTRVSVLPATEDDDGSTRLDFLGAPFTIDDLAQPQEGDVDIDELQAEFDAAMAAARVDLALVAVGTALARGIRMSDRPRLAQLVTPLLGGGGVGLG